VEAARRLGIQVLVTDHHLPGQELPKAAAIVNPNLRGCTFPSKNLAGVGVVFYVMLALRAHLRARNAFQSLGIPEPNLARFLDLVALGTVADVVTLDRNNRILVEQGLRRIRRGVCAVGITALAQVAGRDASALSSNDIGYAIAPRLNAAGRLQDMSIGIECLLTDDLSAATAMAWELDRINAERRKIEADMHSHAVQVLQELDFDNQGVPEGVCLYDPSWHQGVIGILASRIKERLNRPTIAFAPAGGGEIKGSARSVPSFHIRDAIEAVATRHPGLVAHFGGHAMAAGLSLPAESLERFTRAFNEEAGRRLSKEALLQVLHTDGALSEDSFSLECAEILRLSGPWGAGFPEPLFDGVFEIVDSRLLADRHLKMTVRPQGSSRMLQSIWFNVPEDSREPASATVRLVYRLEINDYRGSRTLQLIVSHAEVIQ
jgi:single-stranded-DNA-specific exonuclease